MFRIFYWAKVSKWKKQQNISFDTFYKNVKVTDLQVKYSFISIYDKYFTNIYQDIADTINLAPNTEW